MNLVLILREEIVCLIVLLFLVGMARKYRMGKDSMSFTHLIAFATVHVVMDIVTVITVNNQETVPPVVNYICHVLFYMAAILFSYEIFTYVFKLSFGTHSLKWHLYPLILPVLYLCALPLMKIEYVPGNGTWSSVGSAAIVGYAVAFLYFLAALALVVVFWKKLTPAMRYSLVPMMLLMILAEVAQIIVRELLFTGGALTIVTVGFFFALENPAAALERKSMMDAMTGVLSRNSYEKAIIYHDREFMRDPDTPYTFVFADINNLRSVNGMYGHDKGDELITFVAVSLLNGLKNAKAVYRMGGDEFLAIYYKTGEKTVIRDIARVHQLCESGAKKLEYTPSVAIGYAISNPKYKSLRDALRVADYMMYRNKTEIKRERAFANVQTGTALNLTGLTDKVFDAMCVSSEKHYPFISNLETNVTRIAPGWSEEFGLNEEFFADFNSVWTARIHPGDREAFMQDIAATMNGKKRYHFCRYRALNKNGQYVFCTCRGSVYHGKDGEPDIFAGYVTAEGTAQSLDSATGLQNYSSLDDIVDPAIAVGERFTMLKIGLGNLNRIRGVYGFDTGSLMMKRLGDILTEEVGDDGRAFSNSGTEFCLYMPGADRDKVREVFHRIRQRCENGVNTDTVSIPLRVFGAAAEMPDDGFAEHHGIRAALLFSLNQAYISEAMEPVFFRDTTDVTSKEDISQLASIFMDAITERKHFYMRYQPILRASDGRLVGAEALLRWHDDAHGEVPPVRFIPALETDPAYITLGTEIIRWAVRDAKRIGRGNPGFQINVNITALQLKEESFIPDILRILKEEQFPPECLVLELTERCKEMNITQLCGSADELRRNRIRVALDDMGTGYSTLDLLLKAPVDETKLDRAFVTALQDNSKSILYAKTLCEASSERGAEVCFEGIETDEMRRYILDTFGDVLVQGYYFDKPLLADDFEKKYAKE